MCAQLRISFETPDATNQVVTAGPAAILPEPPLSSDDPLPPLLLNRPGYEMYRDATRTLVRKACDRRWGATIRLGPLSHRYVGGGEDPAALWLIAARARDAMNLAKTPPAPANHCSGNPPSPE